MPEDMRPFPLAILLLFLNYTWSIAAGWQIEVQKFDMSFLNLHKEKFEKFFNEISIDWTSNGLYLFKENEGVSSLYILSPSGKLLIYQYPVQKYSSWINPEKHLNERKSIKERVVKANCRLEIFIEESKKTFLLSFPYEEFPEVLVLDKLSLEQSRVYRSPLYFGFVKDNGLERYFRLVDFRNGRKIDFPPLDSYNEILDNLMAPPFDAYLEDCK